MTQLRDLMLYIYLTVFWFGIDTYFIVNNLLIVRKETDYLISGIKRGLIY